MSRALGKPLICTRPSGIICLVVVNKLRLLTVGFIQLKRAVVADHADLDTQSVATFGTFTEPSGSSHGTTGYGCRRR